MSFAKSFWLSPKSVGLSLCCAALLLGPSATVLGQLQINEIAIDPPGTDTTFEFFELKGSPGLSLDGWWLLFIEGDKGAAPFISGTVDGAIDLSGNSVGDNGLFLWRQSSTVIDSDPFSAGVQGPSAGTFVKEGAFRSPENNSTTIALVYGFEGTEGVTDLDLDDDGIAENLSALGSGAFVADVLGIRENDGTPEDDFAYDLGFADAVLAPVFAFTPDYIARLGGDGVLVADLNAVGGNLANGGTFDRNEFFTYSAYRGLNGDGITTRDEDWENYANSGLVGDLWFEHVSAGTANPVPEPATLLALTLGLSAVAVRRRGVK